MHTRHTSLRWLLIGASIFSTMNCGSDTTSPHSANIDDLYWKLALDQHAITLSTIAPHNTVQLEATPLTVDGTPLTGDMPPITFVSLDSHVQVSANGTVTASGLATAVPVIARMTYRNLTLADTVFITATTDAQPSPLATFSIQPEAGDSAHVGAFRRDGAGYAGVILSVLGLTTKILSVHALDAAHLPVSNVLPYFTSSDTVIATINALTGEVQGKLPGQVWIYASTNYYGTRIRDSLRLRVTEPYSADIQVTMRTPRESLTPIGYFEPDTVVILEGGGVGFGNASTQPIDVVFDDSLTVEGWPFAAMLGFAVTGGNIPPFATTGSSLGLQFRSFPRAGTYTYHSKIYGTSGTILVRPLSQ